MMIIKMIVKLNGNLLHCLSHTQIHLLKAKRLAWHNFHVDGCKCKIFIAIVWLLPPPSLTRHPINPTLPYSPPASLPQPDALPTPQDDGNASGGRAEHDGGGELPSGP